MKQSGDGQKGAAQDNAIETGAPLSPRTAGQRQWPEAVRSALTGVAAGCVSLPAALAQDAATVGTVSVQERIEVTGSTTVNGGSAVNLNTLPLAAVERIEILRDGASAIYGTDAIAGVVNIITRKDYEGVHLSADWGRPTQNGGDEEYYIGSADLMRRNLESRVEVIAPVEEPRLRQELRLILDAQLSSRKNVWEMQADGSYVEIKETGGKDSKDSQQIFIDLAQKRMAAAAKHRQSKLRKKLLNHFHRRLRSNN